MDQNLDPVIKIASVFAARDNTTAGDIVDLVKSLRQELGHSTETAAAPQAVKTTAPAAPQTIALVPETPAPQEVTEEAPVEAVTSEEVVAEEAPAEKAAAKPKAPAKPKLEAVITKEESVSDDKVRCMACGKSMTMLKRHLSHHGLTEEEYRKAFDLSDDHPITAPNYSKQKAIYAKRSGFGTKEARNKKQSVDA